jgi:hypothetical protein
LVKLFQQELNRATAGVSSSRVKNSVMGLQGGAGQLRSPTHRHTSTSGLGVNVGFNTVGLAQASVARHYDVLVPRNASSEDDVILKPSDGSRTFAARMDELVPSTSGVLRVRIGLFADQVVADLLARLRQTAENAWRQRR